MENWFLIAIILGALLTTFIIIRRHPKKANIPPPNMTVPTWSEKESLVFNSINDHRIENGRHPFKKNNFCKHISNDRTLFWLKNGYKKGDNFHEYLYMHTEPYTHAGLLKQPFENSDFSHAVSIKNNWKNSPTHNGIMLGNFTEAGLSIRPKGDGMFYASLIVTIN